MSGAGASYYLKHPLFLWRSVAREASGLFIFFNSKAFSSERTSRASQTLLVYVFPRHILARVSKDRLNRQGKDAEIVLLSPPVVRNWIEKHRATSWSNNWFPCALKGSPKTSATGCHAFIKIHSYLFPHPIFTECDAAHFQKLSMTTIIAALII